MWELTFRQRCTSRDRCQRKVEQSSTNGTTLRKILELSLTSDVRWKNIVAATWIFSDEDVPASERYWSILVELTLSQNPVLSLKPVRKSGGKITCRKTVLPSFHQKDIQTGRTIPSKLWDGFRAKQKKYKIEIRHALNGGEEKICGHYVDGYHQDSKTLFEFYGCYWHGCPRHFPDRNRINPHNCRSMQQLYAETLQKKDTLKEAGYRVIDIWECHMTKCTKRMQTSERLWMPNLPIWIHWDQEMHYLEAEQIQRNCSMKLTRLLLRTRSNISTCVHYIPTSASMECLHWDIQPSYLRRILTKTILDNTVDWSNVKCYHLQTCTILFSHTKLTTNSCFPCVGHVQNSVIVRSHVNMTKKKIELL